MRIPAAGVGVFTTLGVAALYLLPLGDSAGWLLQRMPLTAGVALATTIVTAVLGLGVAPLAAHHGRTLDRVLHGVVLGGQVVPALWVGLALSTVLMATPAGVSTVRYIPVMESATGWLVSLAIPVAALTLGSAAALARQLAQSSAVLLESDLVLTQLSRGLPAGYVFRRHVMRHALPAGASLLALHFLGLFVSILALDAVVVHELDPASLPAQNPEPSIALIAGVSVIVVASVVYLAQRAHLGFLRARGTAL
ncbi:hypothetical protein GY21_04135 [Cryobacterium roopkundense]|uniref:ABC transmembrane type-1 domain-containing protein n=1 Tax=Cryobacterium roopkundense TaxID=1001240 RepID=A0A099JMW6_9MICO|nr:hypothetical protein GY21_04135 [Cryobacterium roopkundense]